MSEPKRVLYETHMHTPLCKHAHGIPEEYAAVADSRGLAGIIVTCHNPIPNGYSASVRMGINQLDDYVAMVERARRAFAGRVDVRLGLECDYAPGMESWLQDLLGRAEFHFVLGSIHPQVDEYFERFFHDDWFEYQKTYFEHLAMAAESGLFDTLAHPDLVKNMAPVEWNLDRILPHIGCALDRIAATGVCMELNTSGLLKTIPEMNPSVTMLGEMNRRGIPVTVGADAHNPDRVGDQFVGALTMLREAGYDRVNYAIHRKRREVKIDEALESLTGDRAAAVASP